MRLDPRQSKLAKPLIHHLPKNFGPCPDTGEKLIAASGRYGAYVTDGETNATVTRGTDPKTLTPEQAFEPIAARAQQIADAGGPEAFKKAAEDETEEVEVEVSRIPLFLPTRLTKERLYW